MANLNRNVEKIFFVGDIYILNTFINAAYLYVIEEVMHKQFYVNFRDFTDQLELSLYNLRSQKLVL